MNAPRPFISLQTELLVKLNYFQTSGKPDRSCLFKVLEEIRIGRFVLGPEFVRL